MVPTVSTPPMPINFSGPRQSEDGRALNQGQHAGGGVRRQRLSLDEGRLEREPRAAQSERSALRVGNASPNPTIDRLIAVFVKSHAPHVTRIGLANSAASFDLGEGIARN